MHLIPTVVESVGIEPRVGGYPTCLDEVFQNERVPELVDQGGCQDLFHGIEIPAGPGECGGYD